MKKNDTRRDAWNFDYLGMKAYLKDNRPHWEVMADDGMNKFLKFCISCVFLWMGYQVVIGLIERFF